VSQPEQLSTLRANPSPFLSADFPATNIASQLDAIQFSYMLRMVQHRTENKKFPRRFSKDRQERTGLSLRKTALSAVEPQSQHQGNKSHHVGRAFVNDHTNILNPSAGLADKCPDSPHSVSRSLARDTEKLSSVRYSGAV
jgi:hypothetical protein